MEDMRNEAARIAAERNSMEIALRLMAQEKLTLEETAKGTSFPMEKVQELAKQQTA